MLFPPAEQKYESLGVRSKIYKNEFASINCSIYLTCCGEGAFNSGTSAVLEDETEGAKLSPPP